MKSRNQDHCTIHTSFEQSVFNISFLLLHLAFEMVNSLKNTGEMDLA